MIKMVNVIALDIDGVLNNDFTAELTPNQFFVGIDDYLVEKLSRIVNATNAEIILTSTWKEDVLSNSVEGNYLIQKLNKYNLDISFISEDDLIHRGSFLIKNLNKYYKENNYNYVILDDQVFDYYELNDVSNHLVLTKNRTGLTDEDVDLAIKILTTERK